jgi:hypothetical protein
LVSERLGKPIATPDCHASPMVVWRGDRRLIACRGDTWRGDEARRAKAQMDPKAAAEALALGIGCAAMPIFRSEAGGRAFSLFAQTVKQRSGEIALGEGWNDNDDLLSGILLTLADANCRRQSRA